MDGSGWCRSGLLLCKWLVQGLLQYQKPPPWTAKMRQRRLALKLNPASERQGHLWWWCAATPMGVFGHPRCPVNWLCRHVTDAQPHLPAPADALKSLGRMAALPFSCCQVAICIFSMVSVLLVFSLVVKRVVIWPSPLSSVRQLYFHCKCAGSRETP